jgi:hypothetical protein
MRKSHTAVLSVGILLGACLLFTDPRAAAQKEPQFVPPPPRDPIERVPPHWDGMRVGMDILVDGQALPTVYHRGKTYLPVPRLGQEYAIRVSNHGPRRIAAVLSVDGLSVIDGRPASEDSPGYVVAPHGGVVIKGWRSDMDTVAAFSFVEREKSYASLVGRPENVGVIGLLAIEERTSWRPRSEPLTEFRGKGGAAPTRANNADALGGTGTGYGREIGSGIYYVPFVRSANRRIVTYYYDTADALRQLGVPVDRPSPSPFPGERPKFVPPPPGYEGR